MCIRDRWYQRRVRGVLSSVGRHRSVQESSEEPILVEVWNGMLVWGYGRPRGWYLDDPYNFKLVDARKYYGDWSVKKHTQMVYLYKPNGCIGVNPAIEWCNVLDYWRPWNRYTNDYYIPYCRQSLCWFQPGTECLARIARWAHLADYQRNMIWDWNLRQYLEGIESPMGNIVTKCFSKDRIAQLPCPLADCSRMKKRDETSSSPLSRLLRVLKRDNTDKRQYCPSFDCANCQTPSGSGECIGSDPWGSRLCCNCMAEQAYMNYL
eukprot:TRINITY_DN4045_c0_g1_i2.p1 TRINITY_DN4045_c0_g1~~TRINITY_DN4045_c0_g1_i2.p1  ORF type:complete len:264 (-),score=53.51 TRINITY_DN4045_c0_g1_i2:28-819(-)